MDDTGRIEKKTANRLILGTANFGQEYRGCLVPKDEQARIWDYCRQVGIDTIDTAMAYGDIEIPADFKVIMKICKEFPLSKDINTCCDKVLLHHIEDFRWAKENHILFDGFSIYKPEDLLGIPVWNNMIIQLPYNGLNYPIWQIGLLVGLKGHEEEIGWLKTFKIKGMEIHARSIFGGGELLEQGYKFKELIEFVWKNQHIDKIVVGVRNCNDLKEIVEIVNEFTAKI